jgi:hypothetical protein
LGVGVAVPAPGAEGEVVLGPEAEAAPPFLPFLDVVDEARGSGAEAAPDVGAEAERPFSAVERSCEPAGVGVADAGPFAAEAFFLFFFELAFTGADASGAAVVVVVVAGSDGESGLSNPPGIDADLDTAGTDAEGFVPGPGTGVVAASEVSPAFFPFFFFAFFEAPIAPSCCCFSPGVGDGVGSDDLASWVYPSPMAPATASTVAAPSGETIDCALPMVPGGLF